MGILSELDEIMALEEKSLAGPLAEGERARWVELSGRLLGTPPSVSERRRYFRVPMVQDAEVRSPRRDPEARVLSMSAGGLFVSTSSVPAVGATMELAIRLPVSRTTVVPFTGVARWVTAAPEGGADPGRVGVGIAFAKLDGMQRAAVIATLRERLLRRLTDALEKYRAYFACLPEAVLVVDGHDSVGACSDLARHLMPRALGDPVGHDLGEIVTDESRPQLAEAVTLVRSGVGPARCTIWLGADDAEAPRPVDAIISPFEGEGGVIVSCRLPEAFDDVP